MSRFLLTIFCLSCRNGNHGLCSSRENLEEGAVTIRCSCEKCKQKETTKLNELSFLNKYCSTNQHQLCDGSWTGFDFQIFCKCDCHKRREATDGFRGPTSVAISHTTQAELREDD